MLIRRIKETKNFSEIDKVIATYILENPECILNNNAKELAILTYTSAPSIVRFCKKLGMQGYPDFRYQYIAEYSEVKIQTKEEIGKESSMSDILSLLPLRYELIAKNSADRINKMELSQIINLFRHADAIDFYATGINFGICQAACIRYSNLGFRAQVQLGVNKHYIQGIRPENKKRTLSFLVSHTGENEAVLEVGRFLKSHNMPIVHIGRLGNELCKISDYHILWDNDRYDKSYDNLSYPVALMFILDVIYLELANSKKEDVVYD